MKVEPTLMFVDWGCNRSTKINSKDVVLSLVLLIILPAAFFPELVLGVQTLTRMDLTWTYYPLHVLSAQNLRTGQWPLWNPYAWCGFPLLAETQGGVLHPFNLLFCLPIASYWALSLFVLLHIGLAAVFTFALARQLGMDPASAWLAGVSFGFGGVLTAQITNLSVMAGLVWLPLILCLWLRTLQTQRVKWVVLTAVAWSSQMLEAQPQIVFYTGLALMACAIGGVASGLWQRHSWQTMLRPVALLVLSAILAAGLSAVQLLPTGELWRQSVRSEGVDYSQMTHQSMPPLQLIELLVPTIFGNPALSYKGADNFDEHFAYVGLIPLLLAFSTLGLRRNRTMVALWVLLGVALALALGGYTPLYSLLKYLPGFSLFRIPARWISIVSLILALLGAYGLHALTRGDERRRLCTQLTWMAVAIAITGIVVGMAVLIARNCWVEWLTIHFPPSETRQLLTTAVKRFFQLGEPRSGNWLPNALWPVTVPGLPLVVEAAVVVGLVFAYQRRWFSHVTLATALIVLTVLDLWVSGGTSVLHLEEPGYWEHDRPLIEAVRSRAGSARAFALDTTTLEARKQHPEWATGERRAIEWSRSYMPAVYGIASPWGHLAPLRLLRFESFDEAVPAERAADLKSVKVIVSWGKLSGQPAELYREVEASGMVHIYENPCALPRAYVASQAEYVKDARSALRRIAEPSFDPHRLVVLEGEDKAGGASPVRPVEIRPASVRLDTPLRLVIDAQADRDAVLVLTDTWYPGWRAYVDGKEVPILRANYLFRGVKLAPGQHTIEFVFVAESFKVGLIISGLTFVAVLILLVRGLWVKQLAAAEKGIGC